MHLKLSPQVPGLESFRSIRNVNTRTETAVFEMGIPIAQRKGYPDSWFNP
jgi:hypothetical protein